MNRQVIINEGADNGVCFLIGDRENLWPSCEVINDSQYMLIF